MKPKHRIFFAAALAAIFIMGGVARADHPRPEEMDAVQRLALQMARDSGALAETARQQRHHFTGQEEAAIRRFDDLNRAANHFYNQVTRYRQDPDHTEADFRELRQAYREARPYFEAIHGTEPVRVMIDRTRDSMRSLTGYYRLERRGGGTSYAQLRDTAGRIRALADRLEEWAEDERHAGRVSEDDVRRIDRVNDAAGDFHDQVLKYQGDVSHIDEEYENLVDRLQDARRSVGRFSGHFQDEFGSLWSLTQSLNFISSEAAIGPSPYGSSPAYAR